MAEPAVGVCSCDPCLTLRLACSLLYGRPINQCPPLPADKEAKLLAEIDAFGRDRVPTLDDIEVGRVI